MRCNTSERPYGCTCVDDETELRARLDASEAARLRLREALIKLQRRAFAADMRDIAKAAIEADEP